MLNSIMAVRRWRLGDGFGGTSGGESTPFATRTVTIIPSTANPLPLPTSDTSMTKERGHMPIMRMNYNLVY